MITANNALITSKAGTWELLINYFKQHYGNERTAADNLKQPVVTYHHTVGENGLGLNQPWYYYQIVQEVLYQQWFRWHGRWYIVGWTTWQIWLRWRRQRHVWWHMNGYNRCSMNSDDFQFWIKLQILLRLVHRFDSGGFIGPKTWCVLYTSIYSTYIVEIGGPVWQCAIFLLAPTIDIFIRTREIWNRLI